MNRRQALLAALAAPATPHSLAAQPRNAPFRATLGTQNTSDTAYLRTVSAFGVTHVCGGLPSPRLDDNWSVDGLRRLKERIESAGVTLAMLPLPLSSVVIEKAEYPSLLLGQSPQRERDVDQICEMIRNASRAGIPALKYNMSVLGVVRTEPTAGRGGAQYSTFKYSAARQTPPSAAAPLPADLYWERISWFLDRVVPVAAECKVKLACHPHDPGMPPGQGLRGVETVLGTVDGLKKFVSIRENPYHGLNFCQGTVSEMLERPAAEIAGVIRWFGSRGKIFNVHFRNIEGKFLDFRETLPDNGEIDMLACLRVYREVGYAGMLMPDHVPHISGDEGGRQAFAFSFGYIRALMQQVAREV